MTNGCDDLIANAVHFLGNKTVAEEEVLAYLFGHPGEMKEQLGERFGLSPQEFGNLMNRLFDISFILETNGRVFPTVFAALVIKSHKELQGIFEKHKEEIQ